MNGKLFLKKLRRKICRMYDSEFDIKELRKGGASIGKNFFYGGSYIDAGFLFLIEIGDDVTLSHSAILAHDGSVQKVCKKSRVGKVKIGNNVFVGYQSIILPNVRIGDNVIIGAGSVVTHDIPNNSIAAGNPCQVIGTYDDFASKHNKYMETHPVYPTYHSFKSKVEIEQMQRELEETWGYDM